MSPRWLGPGATLVRATGTHAGMETGVGLLSAGGLFFTGRGLMRLLG